MLLPSVDVLLSRDAEGEEEREEKEKAEGGGEAPALLSKVAAWKLIW